MRKFITALSIFFIMLGISGVCYAEKIDVNITVTDITDVNNPFNVLVPRSSLEVEYKSLSSYGGTFNDIEAAEGITYLHALTALHEELYGENNVSEYLMLDSSGETHIFMGKSIDSIMYKNGDDIFTLPQLVELHDGDEINVCLYTAGHQQQIATFDKSVIRVPIGEEITLTASEHYDSPVENTPISKAEITDENGILLTDKDGNFITSDESGQFAVTFDKKGVYTVSIMPEVNYYMDGAITPIIEYVPTVTTDTYTIPYGVIADTNQMPTEVREKIGSDNRFLTIINSKWSDDDSEACEVEYSSTELVETIVGYLPDEPKQMISYTPPFCVIDVTDELIVDEVYFSIGEVSDSINVSLKNTDYDSCTVWCAAYKDERMTDVQMSPDAENINFVFGTGNDYYKVMFWDEMTPKTKAYTSKEG